MNSIEGFWALLERGIIGIYHFVSVKHLVLSTTWTNSHSGMTLKQNKSEQNKREEDSYGLDMDFQEALERFLQVKPYEVSSVETEIKKFLEKGV